MIIVVIVIIIVVVFIVIIIIIIIIIIIPSFRGYTCTPAESGSLALFPVRVGGLRTISLCHIAASEYEASTVACEQAFPRYFSPNREPVHRLLQLR